MQVEHSGVNEGCDRDGENRPRDSRDHRTRRHTEQNNQRVQRHGVGHEKRLKEVTLDLLDQQDNDQHDQTDGESLIHDGHQDRNNSRNQGTDNRNERAEKHQNDDRDDQWDTQEVGTDANAQRIDEGNLHLADHIATHACPPANCGLVNGFASALRKQTHEPYPDVATVFKEEEEAEESDHRTGSDRNR